jgi:hypothetical protein
MQNDSLETLLQRYYGEAAPIPEDLDRRLLAALRDATVALQRQAQLRRLQQQRVSRREAFRLALRGASNAGVGLLSIGAEEIQRLETLLLAQDALVAPPTRS